MPHKKLIKQELVESFGYELGEAGPNSNAAPKPADFSKAIKGENPKLLLRFAKVLGIYNFWVPAQNSINEIQSRLDKNQISEEQAIKEIDDIVAAFAGKIASTILTSIALIPILTAVTRVSAFIPFFGPIFSGLSLIAMTPVGRGAISTWLNSNGSWLSNTIATYLLSNVIHPNSKLIASSASLAAEGTKKFGEFSDEMIKDVSSSILHRHSETPTDTTTTPKNGQDDNINPTSAGSTQLDVAAQKLQRIREKLVSLGEKIPTTGEVGEDFFIAYHRHRNEVKGIQESSDSIRSLSARLQLIEDNKSDAEAGAAEFQQDFPDLVPHAQGGSTTPAQSATPAVNTTTNVGSSNITTSPQGASTPNGLPTVFTPNQELLNKAAELTKAGDPERAKIYTDVYARQVAQQKAAQSTSQFQKDTLSQQDLHKKMTDLTKSSPVFENIELGRIIKLAKNK